MLPPSARKQGPGHEEAEKELRNTVAKLAHAESSQESFYTCIRWCAAPLSLPLTLVRMRLPSAHRRDHLSRLLRRACRMWSSGAAGRCALGRATCHNVVNRAVFVAYGPARVCGIFSAAPFLVRCTGAALPAAMCPLMT